MCQKETHVCEHEHTQPSWLLNVVCSHPLLVKVAGGLGAVAMVCHAVIHVVGHAFGVPCP